mgnify:CR=1 FL=1
MSIPGWDKLDEIERALVHWQYRRCGYFKKALWEAIALADDDNLERLRLGFPIEVEGYIRVTRLPGYWVAVVKKAGGYIEAGY